MLGSGAGVMSLFLVHKAYKHLYQNSLSMVKKHVHRESATILWKRIPFFKRFLITKKYSGEWVFTSLSDIAYTYYEKEKDEEEKKKNLKEPIKNISRPKNQDALHYQTHHSFDALYNQNNMVPLCQNTTYDKELFGETYDIKSLNNLLMQLETEKWNAIQKKNCYIK